MIQSTGKRFGSLTTTSMIAPWDDAGWSSSGQVNADNGVYAYITISTFDSGQRSLILKAYGFNFSDIPNSATIVGVIGYIEGKYANGSVSIDYLKLLDTSRAPTGTNQMSTPQALTTSDVTYTRGSSVDLWGCALTPSWVKDSDFGISFGVLATANDADVYIDHVALNIFYDDGLSSPVPTTVPGGLTTVLPTTLPPTTVSPTTIVPTTIVPTTPAPVVIISGDWKDDKGLGAWEFSPQPNKWGYLNNPRWMIPPGRPVSYDGRESEEPQIWTPDNGSNISGKVSTPMRTHIPCGHWHKPVGLPPPTTPAPDICIVYLDRLILDHCPYSSLSGGGVGRSSDSLVYYQEYLYAAGGNKGVIERINPLTMVVEQRTLFNATDISAFKQIIISGGIIYALIGRSGYVGSWIQKLTIPAVGSGVNFALIDPPLYCGSVCYGTDGNVYGAKSCLNMASGWLAIFTPVTGSSWSSGWERLPNAYSYNIDPSVATYAGDVTLGGAMVSFKIDDGNGYILAHGPTSSTVAYSAFISRISYTGVRLNRYAQQTVVGPEELAQLLPSYNEVTVFKRSMLLGGLTLHHVSIDTSAVNQYKINGLQFSGVPLDNSSYHRRTIWWPANGRIYTLYSLYANFAYRIICVSPSGTLIRQHNDKTTTQGQSFAILGNYVYVWHNDISVVPNVHYITKLTLDLEFVCTEVCPEWGEVGRSIESDGTQYLYNYHKPRSGGITGAIAKWSTL